MTMEKRASRPLRTLFAQIVPSNENERLFPKKPALQISLHVIPIKFEHYGNVSWAERIIRSAVIALTSKANKVKWDVLICSFFITLLD